MLEGGAAISRAQSESYFAKNFSETTRALSLDVKIIQRHSRIGLIFILTKCIRKSCEATEEKCGDKNVALQKKRFISFALKNVSHS